MPELQPVRIGILGCGAVTRLVRIEVYRRMREVARVVAVCDPDAERARTVAAEFDSAVDIYTSPDALLADPHVDALDICTPHALHAHQTVQALQRGKHVLVEKPMATTLTDARHMLEIARWANRVLAVNEQIRHELAAVRVNRLFLLPQEYAASGWRNDPSGVAAGVLIDQGPHYAAFLRTLAGAAAGEITEVAALVAAMSDRQPVANNVVALLVRFASGLIGEALLSWSVPTPPGAAIGYAFGNEGSLDIETETAGLVWHRAANLPTWPGPEYRPGIVHPKARRFESVESCIREFVASVRSWPSTTTSAEQGLRDLAVVDAAVRSITSRRFESPEPV